MNLKRLWSEESPVRKHHALLFFVLGFLFDLLTLGRIDTTFNLIQQAAYLIVIGWTLKAEALELEGKLVVPRWLQKIWSYETWILHFLLGGLLNAYMIFYFKSASVFVSFAFLAFLGSVVLLNELPSFQRHGLSWRLVLYTLCVCSYMAYLIPIGVGFVGLLPFLISILFSMAVTFSMLRSLKGRLNDLRFYNRKILLPCCATIGIFVAAYILEWIPPVPISVSYMGIFHEVKRSPEGYVLVHETPSWKFWSRGDQAFYARPGDRIYFYARIFSPTLFKDQVYAHWVFLNRKNNWETWDRIPIEIVGGREEGFRAFAFKSNYQPGFWQVRLETSDSREIGRLGFEVLADARVEPRELFETLH